MMRKIVMLASASLALACAFGRPVEAYFKLAVEIGNRQVPIQWKQVPVRYSVSDRGAPGVSPTQLQAALERAFQVWRDVPTSSISFQFAGFTGRAPFAEDGVTTVGFLNIPELDGVLGAAGILVDEQTGEVLESDIFFNSAYPWSVAQAGQTGRFDLESIAVHEIGHLAGLGHSALGDTELRTAASRVTAAETVMFPIAFDPGSIDGRRLKADDIAGISDLYPDADFRANTAGIQGRVRRSDRGVLGAHVVAFNPKTGSLIAGFALNQQGDFAIAGLGPGLHILRVEPIDDGDPESFFDEPSAVDTSFKTTYHGDLIVAPRGGSTAPFDIRVQAK